VPQASTNWMKDQAPFRRLLLLARRRLVRQGEGFPVIGVDADELCWPRVYLSLDPERTLNAHDRTALSRSWLEFGFWRDLQRGEISRRFGLNIFDTGQFNGYIESASIT
jgi:hypothetical protein